MSYEDESDDEGHTEEKASRKSLQDELKKIFQARGMSISVEEADEIAVSMATRYSGPIPPPEQLGEYERILPGCADRIIRAFENQQTHRIQLADRTNKSQLHQGNIGQIMGGLMVLSCMGITGKARRRIECDRSIPPIHLYPNSCTVSLLRDAQA